MTNLAWQETFGLMLGGLGVLFGILGPSPLPAYIRSRFPEWWPNDQSENNQETLERRLDGLYVKLRGLDEEMVKIVQANKDHPAMMVSSHDIVAVLVRGNHEAIELVGSNTENLLEKLSTSLREVRGDLKKTIRAEGINGAHQTFDKTPPSQTR